MMGRAHTLRVRDPDSSKPELECWHLELSGLIQGVGFRPFIYRLAHKWSLKGWVLNSGTGVSIEIEGSQPNLNAFFRALPTEKPALAQIESLRKRMVASQDYKEFRILDSQAENQTDLLVPPDLAMCPECREEVLATGERYYHYPFTNCTNCGPRFTLIRGLPYDRGLTSMADFSMCPACEEDYHNPDHRRFHAQPTACHHCGPKVYLLDHSGLPLVGDWNLNFHNLMRSGKIVAVKGIGGFHLVCSGRDAAAIRKLRQLKQRPFRPLAIMARDLEAVKRYCVADSNETEALLSQAAPIVILKSRGSLPAELAPHNSTLGVMLPYSPLHLLLFSPELDVLVMTSGNARGLPIAKDNEEALKDLAPFVDAFLMHDRVIVNRCDDSVVRLSEGKMQVYRRSRGYVPSPINLAFAAEVDVMGMGGEMKNTFCLLKGKHAFFSQHLGDMGSLEGLHNYGYALSQLQELLDIRPAVIGYDPHPGYGLNHILTDSPPELVQIPVQHHHAHMASVMAEYGLSGDVMGVVLDGTGYGSDGRLWGFEILSGGYENFTRHIHVEEVPLPGGERAVRNPWLVAAAYLMTLLGSEGKESAARLFPAHEGELDLVQQMLQHELNTPLASSAGRLFDAISAILGICLYNTYDGQAAIELGDLVGSSDALGSSGAADLGIDPIPEPYPFTLTKDIITVKGIFLGILKELNKGIDRSVIALRFHLTITAMVLTAVLEVRRRTGLNRVVLSGGVWQNPFLLNSACRQLTRNGFVVYTNRQIPANDGGLALGQAAVAYWRWKKNVSGYSC